MKGRTAARLMQAFANEARIAREDLVARKAIVSLEEMTAALGVSREALSMLVRTNKIFSVEVGHERYYPRFFVDPTIERRKLECVSRALGDLRGWEKWRFFTTGKLSLGTLTPLAALKRGMYREVLIAARGFAER